MKLYTSNNIQTKYVKKGIYYLDEIPEDSVIFGATDLHKYKGGYADYLKVEDKRYRVMPPIKDNAKIIGYIPVNEREIPIGERDVNGYIQLTGRFNPLLLLLPLILLLLIVLFIAAGNDKLHKKDVVSLPKHDYVHDVNQKTTEPFATNKPDDVIKRNDDQTNEKDEVEYLPERPVTVPGSKNNVVEVANKNSAEIVQKSMDKNSEESKDQKSLKYDKDTNTDIIVPEAPNPTEKADVSPSPTPVNSSKPDIVSTPEPVKSDTTATPIPTNPSKPTPEPESPVQTEEPVHLHTYVVNEKEPTCTGLGFYKKYCSECGYVVADHTCAAMGHTNSVVNVSNMTYPEGMSASYVCDRCGEIITDNFDYTAGLYKADGSLLYTYDALEQIFDWNLSTTIAKDLMDAHGELSDGRILVLPSWSHLMAVAEASSKASGITDGNGGFNDGAFADSILTEVVLPNDTPYLGQWFVYSNIETLSLPDSIIEYKGVVANNNNLRYLKVSASVPEITATFMSNKHLSTLIIPEGVTALKSTAFARCGYDNVDGMNISLPNTLKQFGVSGSGGVFAGAKIPNLVLPGSIEELYPIVSIEGIKELIFENGIKEIPAYFYPADTLERVVIPGSVKKIGESAFSATTNTSGSLKEIVLEEGIEEIGSNFIQRQNNVRQLIIPDSVKSLTNQIAVSNNMNLIVLPKEVSFDDMPIININNRSSSTWDGTPGHIIMPNNITRIVASSSFIIWDSLEEIVLPGGDYSGCYSLFQNCNNLKKITFTSEITGLNKNFFRYIPSVTDIYYYGSEESINKLINTYRTENPTENPYILFMNATIHYMTGNPPTREDLMKEYGVEEGVYELYSDETYANAVERHKAENASLTESPVEMLQLSETQLFDSEKESDLNSVKTEAHTHLLSIDEKAPTCTEDGYYRVTCSVCDEVLADHVCKKLGHNMQMIDPEDNTTDIIIPRFECNRCDYTESTNHTHNWIAKGYENMTYPNGGDEIYVCAICLSKKAEHVPPVSGMYTESGELLYTYSELEETFDWNLSTTPAKTLMDDHTELDEGHILVLPSWEYLSKVAENSNADCGLIKTGSINCFEGSILSKVILPDDCDDFGNWFTKSNITELELPDSITDYKECGVSSANNLKSLKLSANAIDLTNFKAQGNTELVELIIPEGVENLGISTFAGASKLESVELPHSLTDIGSGVFAVAVIEYLEIPENVKVLGRNSLTGMGSLEKLVLHDGLEKIEGYAFTSLRTLEEINIPSTVTEMGECVFGGLPNLKTVVFEDGLTVIGNNLFQGCTGLKKIIIPDSVKDIPKSAFNGIQNLEMLVLPDEVNSLGGDGLFNCGYNNELKIVMPTVIKEWKSGATFCSPKLKEIVLPGNIDLPLTFISNMCNIKKVVITGEPNNIVYGAFGYLHNADIYYYGSRESVQKFNEAAGGNDVFLLNENGNRLHYMTGNPPTREDQMNDIDYDNLEEVAILNSVSGGNAE